MKLLLLGLPLNGVPFYVLVDSPMGDVQVVVS